MTHLGFSNGNTDQLSSHISKQGKDEGVDESQKLPQITSRFISDKRFSILPINETESLLAWDTS